MGLPCTKDGPPVHHAPTATASGSSLTIEQAPDGPVLAIARDATVLATLLITYRHAAERMEPELPENFLQLAAAALRACEARLRGLSD
ncbi:hypothetical protein [Streptomyces plumbiresistens]|uniref:Uncharacterized protein n=1 Tax=Streptomyces plumbiresistens TaxID=511811 RepID=A0ABP7TQ14_9ACTN